MLVQNRRAQTFRPCMFTRRQRQVTSRLICTHAFVRQVIPLKSRRQSAHSHLYRLPFSSFHTSASLCYYSSYPPLPTCSLMMHPIATILYISPLLPLQAARIARPLSKPPTSQTPTTYLSSDGNPLRVPHELPHSTAQNIPKTSSISDV